MFFYVSGSSTKQTVYKDQAGTVAWSNPIVLDSGGNLPSGGVVWLSTGVEYTVKWAPSNDTDPPASPYRTIDDVSGINDTAAGAVSEWVDGPAPTFVSVTSFAMAGDQQSAFQVGRRVETVNTGGTIYGRISAVAFAAGSTTIQVVNDSGALDAGLSAVSYGILSATNPSFPVLADTHFLVSDNSDRSKTYRMELSELTSSTQVIQTIPLYSHKTMTQTYAGTISSASTTQVSSVSGSLVDITGTTTINELRMFEGQRLTARFVSTMTLASSASLVIGQSIVTKTGDIGEFRGLSSSVTLLTNYYTPTALGRRLLTTGSFPTATTRCNIVFSGAPYTLYNFLEFRLIGVVAQAAGSEFNLRTSSTGAVFDSGGSDYIWHYEGGNVSNDQTSANIRLTPSAGSWGVDSIGTRGVDMSLRIFNNSTGTTRKTQFIWNGSFQPNTTSPVIVTFLGSGFRDTTNAVVGIQLFMNVNSTVIHRYEIWGEG